MIAVSFDPAGPGDAAQLTRALAGGVADVVGSDGFRAACSDGGQAAVVDGVHCVLDGDPLGLGELRRDLALPADTPSAAVIARAFRRWGVDVLGRLRGTFAIAMWDSEQRCGVVSGDQFALVPWYMRRSGGRVSAATSMRVLLRLLPSAPAPDPVRVMAWLASGYPPGVRTFASGVEYLAGGHAVLLRNEGTSIHRWWTPRYREPVSASHREMVGGLRDAVHRAVRARLAEDGSTGVILSGGFDSSAVAAAAASEGSPERLRTYSAGFPDDPSVDESARTRELVAARGLPNFMIHPQASGIVRLALDFQRAWGVPCAGPGYVLERPLLEAAVADGVTAVLDGQGGDEVFGFSPYVIADRVRSGRVLDAARLLGSLPDQHGLARGHRLRLQLREYALRPLLPAALERGIRLRGDATRHLPAWVRRDRLGVFLEGDGRLDWLGAGDGPLWWRHRVYLMTTAWGTLTEYIGFRGRDLPLRMRPPLIDVDLMEHALTLPPDVAFGGINRALARESVAGEVPDHVRLAARKSDLQPFYHRMLAGEDLASLRALLAPADARIYEYVDRDHVAGLLEQPSTIGAPRWGRWSLALWSCLTGEIALRDLEDAGFAGRFIERQRPPEPRHTEIR